MSRKGKVVRRNICGQDGRYGVGRLITHMYLISDSLSNATHTTTETQI